MKMSLITELIHLKTTLVESISDYLEEYVDEAIPAQAIEEATKNRTLKKFLLI
jgi:hypothetical protein